MSIDCIAIKIRKVLGCFKIANFNVDQAFGEFIVGNSTLEDG